MSLAQRIPPVRSRKALATLLILACLVPAFAGVYRGTTLILENNWKLDFLRDRVDALPLFLHAVGSATFFILAAIQVWPTLRNRFPTWHRKAGKVALIAGFVGALSSVWITVVHSEVRGEILFWGRLIFGPLWALFLGLGYLAIRRGDSRAHQAWMIRAFAVAMPAGTLIFILGPLVLLLGNVPDALDESVQSGAWVVHLAVAEWCLKRRPRSPR